MVSNLVDGEADLITANLAICCQRSKVIDYMWTLSAATSGFGIKSNIFEKKTFNKKTLFNYIHFYRRAS